MRSMNTWFAVCASGARAPAAVASCAMSTVVCRTMASMSKLTFTPGVLSARWRSRIVSEFSRAGRAAVWFGPTSL
jgi:hypothetical protein